LAREESLLERGRELCARHAGPLLILAAATLQDVQIAGEVVAEAVAAACQAPDQVDPGHPAAPVQLARSVYHRCLGRIATEERFPGLPTRRVVTRRPARTPLSELSPEQRAVITLSLFGGASLHDTAFAVGVSTDRVLTQLSAGLSVLTDLAAPAHGSVDAELR
jgi:DNA-directed RNA polymerase specialized sigma24 family protein